MSGPWEKYTSPAEPAGPWTKYAGAGDAGLSLDVTPDPALRPTSRLLDVMNAPGPVADYLPGPMREQLLPDATVSAPPLPPESLTPNADAASEALWGSLAKGASSLPLAMGGAADLLRMPKTRDHFFDSTTKLRRTGEQLLADAQRRNKPGATLGGVVSILPQLLAPELLAGQIVSGGTEPALSALDKGADVPTAEKLMAVGTVGNAAANLIPVGASGNALVRALVGTGTNAGAAYAIPKAEEAVAPGYVDAPTLQDVITQGGVGGILAAALGHQAPAAGRSAFDDILENVRNMKFTAPGMDAPLGLPKDAPINGEFRTGARPTPPPSPGTVRVTPQGEAFTPAQGKTVLAQALDEALRGKPVGLPEPTVAVDRAGTAMTTADQHALATQPPAPAEDLMAMLGLTPDVVRAQARDPRRARDVGLPQLPAPSIAVDSAGNAMTSADFLAKAKAAQGEADVRTAEARRKAELGLTPDVERAQAPRLQRQAADAADRQSMQDAPNAQHDELAQQGENDAPPWWMAAHGAELDNAAAKPAAAPAAAMPAEPAAHATPPDAADVEALRHEIGWAERGGRMLRAVDTGGEKPEVVGRTAWVGKPGPGGEESGFWRFRPDEGGRLTEFQANRAIDKYVRGERLNKREQRFIDYARKTAKDYADRHAQEQAAFERDQADMDAAAHALARQELVDHGTHYNEADQSEALTLAQWVRRAHDAGVPESAIIDATWEGTPAEQSARLSRAIIEQEYRRGHDEGAAPFGRSGGVAEDQGGQRPAGAVREDGHGYALEAQRAGPEARPQVTPSQSGLFAPATAAERNRAAIASKDAQRNGLGRDLVRPEQGSGELLAGPRPQQTHIEDTAPAALRRFMAGSKVTRPDGRPRVVYHGTAEEFDVFGAHRAGGATGHSTAALGHFFTESRAQAQRYAENASDGRPADERVIDAYLSIKNPAEWSMARMQRIETPEQARAARRNLEASGFDGIHIADAGQWIAFRPEQIKSASANRGTFDPTDPSMVREGAPRAEASSRDMFTRTRGDLEASRGQDQAGNGRQDGDSRPAGAGGLDAGGLRLRPDGTPALARRGEHEVDALVRRFGGSVLADTIARDFREKGAAQLVGQTVRTIDDFAALAQVYRNPLFETLHYVFVDSAGRVLGESAVSSRLPSASAALPQGEGLDWLENMARKYNATGVWLSHNHPSGVPTPSGADIELTTALAQGLRGVRVLGHVVLDHLTYGKIEADGTVSSGRLTGNESDPLRNYRGFDLGEHVISGPDALAALGRQLADLTPDNSIAVICANSQLKVSLVTAFPRDFFDSPHAHHALTEVAQAGAASYMHAVMSHETMQAGLEGIKAAMDAGLLYDAVVVSKSGKVASLAQQGMMGAPVSQRLEDRASTLQVFDTTHGYDAQVDMPSRRPGESQEDYIRRVRRKNKDEIKAGLALAKHQREIGRLGMRAMWAQQDRALATADAAFAEYRKLFDKEDQRVNLRTIDQWENGQPIEDYDARQFFGLMKEAFDQRTAKIQSLAPDAMQQLIDNYFPHIWEDSGKALKWYQGLSAKRPLQGDRSFLKQRVHATIKDGMATGLKPVSTNPVDLAILKLGQMDKFIAFHEFRKDLERRGWLKKMEAGERVPVGYARVEDPAFQIAGGLQGYYAVPELIARDINNYLSPSLYRFGAWKALRTVQNVLMSSRLGLSMFHGGFTTMDNLVMHADVAGRRLMHGDLAGGISTLLKTPLSIVWSPFEGGRLNKEWLGLKPSDEHTAAVLDMLEQGGAHMKMSATDYNNALPKLIRAVRQKSASGTLKQTLPAISEAISWVIHHKLVPAQKMAARVMLAKFELDRVAGALGKARGDYSGIIDALHPDALKQIAAHVVNLVDDRLGQMNYDNQFWNKTAREAAQAAIGAVGWQIGTLRTVTGGARDLVHLWKPEKLLSTLDKAGNVEGDLGRVSGRLTYLVTLALLMGGLSAVTQYLLTGDGPSELKDYFFPKTGNKNDDGSAERLQWPSYWSDHYKLATHPLQTALHKVHPSMGMLMEALANQDYYGTEIRDPDASWWKQAEQVGEYLAKGFVPYSLTGADKLKGVSTGRQVANFFGITRAPASVSRSRFESFVAEKAYNAMPQGARSQQQAEHAKAMHDAEAAIRRGEEPSMEGLSPDDRRNVDKAARMEVPAIRFRRLSIEDKLRAYDLATPAERERYRLAPIILRSNWHKAVRDLPDADREAVLAKIQALIP